MYLSVIIPAYNEEKRLPDTLRDMHAVLSSADFEYEIIVVSDGSKDGTVRIAEELAGEIRGLRVIGNAENHGKGWVTKQGMREARGAWRLFTDADNSTTMREFKKLQPYLTDGYGAVFGSRALPGSVLHPPQPWYRRIPGKIGNLIIQALVLPGIRDTQCGFKCFSASAAEAVFPKMKTSGWGFDVEALALTKRAGFKLKEIPIEWRNDTRSTLEAGAYISTLIEVAKIRWWLLANAYEKK